MNNSELLSSACASVLSLAIIFIYCINFLSGLIFSMCLVAYKKGVYRCLSLKVAHKIDCQNGFNFNKIHFDQLNHYFIDILFMRDAGGHWRPSLASLADTQHQLHLMLLQQTSSGQTVVGHWKSSIIIISGVYPSNPPVPYDFCIGDPILCLLTVS